MQEYSMSLQPLIAICGTTGVGKSNLAIQLALQLAHANSRSGWRGARIINADSMQVYKGLDVTTNKVPEADRRGIEHLLMGFKQPGEQYVVGQWVQDAMKVIDETHRRKEIPIVVGGTSYWIQHLIFPNRLSYENTGSAPAATTMSQELRDTISNLPSELLELYNNLPEPPPSATADPEIAFRLHFLLSILDPSVAARWHWKDTRKVLRNLRIFHESGRRPSEIMTEQTKNTTISKPRYHTLCFWLYAESSVLEERLNTRVDNMIEQGLLDEIRSLHEIATCPRNQISSSDLPTEGSVIDYTLGIYQSIGYKEFRDYLTSPISSAKDFNTAVENMKISTRQYAKRQVSWVRNKLLPAIHAANADEIVAPTYVLNATELGDQWGTNVRDLAVRITEDFLEERELTDPSSLSEIAREMLSIEKKSTDPISVLQARRKVICPVCTIQEDRPLMIEQGREWEAHRKTRTHRRRTAWAANRFDPEIQRQKRV